MLAPTPRRVFACTHAHTGKHTEQRGRELAAPLVGAKFRVYERAAKSVNLFNFIFTLLYIFRSIVVAIELLFHRTQWRAPNKQPRTLT